MTEFSRKLFAATRTDGLGGRLMAVINAKCLADKMGCRFGFTWNSRAITDMQFHFVDFVEKVFSPDFVDKHWLGEKVDGNEFRILGRTKFTLSNLQADARRTDFRGWICDDFHVLKLFREKGIRGWLPGNAPAKWRTETFRTLGFSAPVRAALDAAGNCRFSRPMAALHLRSGDIVRGRFRSTLVFGDKVVPSTLARAIVAKLSSKGLAVLLVGQDRATLDYLKSETGAFLVDDVGANEFEDQTSRSFFEMALMARCRRIYAETSVFASVSSIIGGVPALKTKALFGRHEAAKVILDELKIRQADYHPLEAAFGYQSAFLLLENRISTVQARDILEKAAGLDPENDVYALKIATSYFREKDYASGEVILKTLMTRQFRTLAGMPLPIMRILTGKVWRDHAMSKDFGHFFAAAKAGHPYAAACSAHILHAALGKAESAMDMAELSLKTDPANELFQQIALAVQPAKARRV